MEALLILSLLFLFIIALFLLLPIRWGREEEPELPPTPPGELARMGRYLLLVRDPDQGLRVDPEEAVEQALRIMERIRSREAVGALWDSREWDQAFAEAAVMAELLARAVAAGRVREDAADRVLLEAAGLLGLGTWDGVREILDAAWHNIQRAGGSHAR